MPAFLEAGRSGRRSRTYESGGRALTVACPVLRHLRGLLATVNEPSCVPDLVSGQLLLVAAQVSAGPNAATGHGAVDRFACFPDSSFESAHAGPSRGLYA